MKSLLTEPQFLANLQGSLPVAPKVLTQVSQELCVRKKRHKVMLWRKSCLTSAKREVFGYSQRLILPRLLAIRARVGHSNGT